MKRTKHIKIIKEKNKILKINNTSFFEVEREKKL